MKTLKRAYLLDDIPYPKVPRRLPTILTVEDVTRLIDAARTLTERTMLMVLYSTGMRYALLDPDEVHPDLRARGAVNA